MHSDILRRIGSAARRTAIGCWPLSITNSLPVDTRARRLARLVADASSVDRRITVFFTPAIILQGTVWQAERCGRIGPA